MGQSVLCSSTFIWFRCCWRCYRRPSLYLVLFHCIDFFRSFLIYMIRYLCHDEDYSSIDSSSFLYLYIHTFFQRRWMFSHSAEKYETFSWQFRFYYNYYYRKHNRLALSSLIFVSSERRGKAKRQERQRELNWAEHWGPFPGIGKILDFRRELGKKNRNQGERERRDKKYIYRLSSNYWQPRAKFQIISPFRRVFFSSSKKRKRKSHVPRNWIFRLKCNIFFLCTNAKRNLENDSFWH